MHALRPLVLAVLATALGAGGAVSAQTPVAVPIVGSPAAQQPAAPAAPPSVPTRPPAMPPAMPAVSPAEAAARSARKLELTVADGSVALDAQNVTLREILTEWQRRSGCQFVNADKLPATPMTIQFPAGTPELKVIDSLLHGLGTTTTGYGYMVAPRSATDPTCGAVYILPTSRPTASTPYVAATPSPIAAPLVTPGSPDDEIPPVTPFPPGIPPQPPQPRPIPGLVPGQSPNPGIPPGQPGQNPSAPAPGGASPTGFGPVAPTAPGAGRIGGPPATPPGGTGRGGTL